MTVIQKRKRPKKIDQVTVTQISANEEALKTARILRSQRKGRRDKNSTQTGLDFTQNEVKRTRNPGRSRVIKVLTVEQKTT